MGLRPQTFYGIADLSIGLAAYMPDHDASSYTLITRVFDGQTEGLTKDDIIDYITLYCLTNTGISSACLYCETFQLRQAFSIREVSHASCRERFSMKSTSSEKQGIRDILNSFLSQS